MSAGLHRIPAALLAAGMLVFACQPIDLTGRKFACSSDLDCVAPDTCVEGTCGVSLAPDSGSPDAGASPNLVFVTSATVTPGQLGSRTAGDALCGALAADAGFSGRFVAWLGLSSDSNTLNRLGSARGWVRPDGLPFTDQLLAGINTHDDYPPSVDEHGNVLASAHVVTGTSYFMTYSGFACGDWAQVAGSATVGTAGAGLSEWTYDPGNSLSCASSAAHLLCFENDRQYAVTVPPAPSGARRAFVLPTAGGGGQSALDAACQAAAKPLSPTGTQHFLAFVATSGASAGSRFSLDGGPWYRPDDVQIVGKPEDLLSATPTLLAPIDEESDGSGADWPAVTGATDPTQLATSNCNDWTSDAGTPLQGTSVHTDGTMFRNTVQPFPTGCGSLYVYCLEN